MHPAIPRLIDLQTIDLKIAGFRAQLEAFPKRIMDLDAKLSGARSAVASAKEAHVTSAKERKKFELDVDQWKERARKYRDQSGAVKTNEAYKALQHEIANAEAEVSKAEDRQLELMMGSEEIDGRLRHADADLKEAEASVAADRKEIEHQYAAKKKELAAAQAEREKAVAPIPEDMVTLYDRIAKRHNGHALAQVKDGQCKGCGLRVLPHTLQLLTLDHDDEEVFRCESCGLILYSLEPLTAINPDAASGDVASATTSAPDPKPGANATPAYRANIDGGSRGNPGPAAYGVLIRDAKGEPVARLKKYIGRMTNNVAEYYGLIAALDYVEAQGIRALRIESDSELLVKQMKGLYKVRSPELAPLYERARKMASALDSFRIDHVYREHNREADALANEAMDEVEGPDAKPRGSKAAAPPAKSPAPSAATTAATTTPASGSAPKGLPGDVRKIRARYRAGVLYLLEDVELPDGLEIDVLLRVPRKS
jgi:ribonuclease HI